MKYYSIYVCEDDSVRLEPNVEIGGSNPLGQTWDEGLPLRVPDHVTFVTYRSKKKLNDWIDGYSWIPYVKESVKNRLEPILGNSVQWIGPIECKRHNYYMLNCINVLDCLLPESTSNHLFFDPEVIKSHLLFRPKGNVRQLIAAEELKANIFNAKDTGIRFGPIRDDGSVTWFPDAEIPSRDSL